MVAVVVVTWDLDPFLTWNEPTPDKPDPKKVSDALLAHGGRALDKRHKRASERER